MSDRDRNIGSRDSQNPDRGRNEDSGLSGSRPDRDSDLGRDSSRDSGLSDSSRDRSSTGGSGSDRQGSEDIGDENVSNR